MNVALLRTNLLLAQHRMLETLGMYVSNVSN